MERFDDDTGPSGLSTAQWTRFVEVGDQRVSVAGAGWRVAKDGRSDRIAAAVVWAIKGADAFGSFSQSANWRWLQHGALLRGKRVIKGPDRSPNGAQNCGAGRKLLLHEIKHVRR